MGLCAYEHYVQLYLRAQASRADITQQTDKSLDDQFVHFQIDRFCSIREKRKKKNKETGEKEKYKKKKKKKNKITKKEIKVRDNS